MWYKNYLVCNENHSQWKRYQRHITNVSITLVIIISALQIEQLPTSIAWRVLELQSDTKMVPHVWFQTTSISYFEIMPWAANFVPLCNSTVDCARELSKPSKDSASILVCLIKNFWFWVSCFCGWHNKWDRFLTILAQVTWTWAQPLDWHILLMILFKTRLKSKSFEPLIGLLAFLVEELG